MIGADLLHLVLDLARDAVRIPGDQVAAADQSIPVELGEIAPLAVSLAKIIERPLRGERGDQLLVHRSLVDRFVEAAVKDGEKIAHGGLAKLLSLLVRLVDIDVTAENEIVRRCFPTLVAGAFAVVIKSIFDLSGGL